MKGNGCLYISVKAFIYVLRVCNTIQDRFFLGSYDKLQQFVTKFVSLMGIKTLLISPKYRPTYDGIATKTDAKKL